MDKINNMFLESHEKVSNQESYNIENNNWQVQEGYGKVSRFSIISETEHHVKKFNIIGKRVCFEMIDPPADENPIDWFKDSMRQLIEYIVNEVDKSEMVGLAFETPNFIHGKGWLSFRRADQLDIDVVWDVIYKILQSNSTIFTDGQFTVELTRVVLPRGTGNSRRLRASGMKFAEFCQRKHGLVEIRNEDNLCLPRSLIVAESWIKKDAFFPDIVLNKNGLQNLKVQNLLSRTNIKIPINGASISELEEFQRFFIEYNIVVYEFRGNGNVIFEGAKNTNLPRLNLLYNNNHFCVIKSLTAAFCCTYFCEPCHKPYYKINEHKCKNKCALCFSTPACKKDKNKINKCVTCNREFHDQNCYDNHLGYVCNTVQKCKNCFKIFNPRKHQHKCGEVFCILCNAYKIAGHKCYMSPLKERQEKSHLFIYYDFEARQEKTLGKDKLHEVNLCVIQQSCTDCWTSDNVNKFCNSCGIRQHIYKKDCIANFISYVLLPRTSFSTITCIAHNAKNYDCQFILKYLVETLNIKPHIILNGNKILLLEINKKIRFIDSINYLPMPLSSLPKALDLSEDISKLYFPHLFNTNKNQKYIGPIPGIQYYGADLMRDEVRTKFLQWHEQQVRNNVIFDMAKSLVTYCTADVEILRRACEKFRDIFLETGDVCPFTESITIASACNRVFRRLFLKPKSIGLIPARGYRLNCNQSKIALQWLIYEENKREIRIEHAGHGSEAVLAPGLIVDGYYAPQKLVFEFMGCFWHGCKICFRTNRNKQLYNSSTETLDSRYERTISKINKLKHMKNTIIIMWECEFRKFLKLNSQISRNLEHHNYFDNLPLNPRDALFGGRTGNVSLYHKIEENEQIRYVDVCSLYPFICKYGVFPVDHPTVLVGAECNQLVGPDNNLDKVEGLIKCKVLPPTALFHPVLPRKVHNKLMFALCRTCCDELEQNDCNHTDEDRAFIGTWVINEVRRAVELGYKILHVYEIWQYKIVAYDKATKSGGLFAEYINKYLKIKQEASGYPAECKTDLAKQNYINEYYKKEGILLDADNIKNNAGRRSQAKLCLNSFWGKFAQAENKSRTTIVSSAEELYEYFSNPAIEIHQIIPAGDNHLYVNWQLQYEAREQLRTVNVVIAAYTTAQARLRLHEYLHALGSRVLYYDTDSIIYRHKPGQFEPDLGNFLGDLTCELSCYGEGSYIIEFVCAGPKSYAYKVFSPATGKTHSVCKVKGFTLNYKNIQTINFECLKNLILKNSDDDCKPIIVSDNIKTTAQHDVVTRREIKKFKINFVKRKLVDNYISIPYGYKRFRL